VSSICCTIVDVLFLILVDHFSFGAIHVFEKFEDVNVMPCSFRILRMSLVKLRFFGIL
jgi:hypothetical protein